MKIGILTFHCAHNYGAVLQCYALQETLKEMGHDVEVIDYKPDYLIRPYKVFDIHRFLSRNPYLLLKRLIKEVLLLHTRTIHYTAFHSFISKRLHISTTINGKNIPADYDIYIFGSDQIWNPQISKGFEPIYFGYLPFPKSTKKYVAYAASMECSSLSREYEIFYRNALENFDAISVRESALAKLLQPLTYKKIEVVLDPTLLIKSRIWMHLAKTPNINKKYVLVYQILHNERTATIAQSVAQQLNAMVIEIKSPQKIYSSKHELACESPESFLGWIKNASCIITTSFHGTAFSIIFNRPFYSIALNGWGDSRSRSLLQSVGLEDRMITGENEPKFSKVDYSKANLKISGLREASLNFLIESTIVS